MTSAPRSAPLFAAHAAALAGSPLFRGAGADAVRAKVASLGGIVRRYAKGAAVPREGDRATAAGVLLEGRLLVCRTDWDGRRDIVETLGPGALFAASYALAGEPLAVGVEADSPVTALFLDAARLAASDLAARLVPLLARKNLALNEKLAVLSRRRTRDKVLAYLAAQSVRAGARDFEIPLSRQGLADYLAVDRSALSAELGRLRREGVLDFRKNRFRLR